MSEQYTPTMEEVRAVWREWANYGGLTNRPYDSDDRSEMGAEFRRWYAAERAKWQAEAWDAAVAKVRDQHPLCTEECEMCTEMDDWLNALTPNPYRTPGAQP